MFDEIIENLGKLDAVRLIMLGGSRAKGNPDKLSDYDVYVYCDEPIPVKTRQMIFEKYFRYMEYANDFWEEEDDGIMWDGVEVEFIYRSHSFIKEQYENILIRHQVSLGYSTCIIFNLLKSIVLVDKQSDIEWFRSLAAIYPDELRKKIIQKNAVLIADRMPSMSFQLIKAIKRQDVISVQHRTTELLALMFDVLFAVNRMYHPGEKRLMEALERMSLIPDHFKEDVKLLLVLQTLSKDEAIQLVKTMGDRMNAFIRLWIPEYQISEYIQSTI
jgi:predicted nucleotidyltransferase